MTWGLAALTACGVPVGRDPGAIPAGPARTGTLTGVVADPSGSPIAGAHVISDPRGYEATAGADGAFEIDRLPPGPTSVAVSAPGFATAESDPVVVAAGDSVSVSVALAPADGPPPPELDVSVIGPDDLPYEGATISVGAASATTDPAGAATITDLAPGPIDVIVAAPGLWTRTVRGFALPATGSAHLEVALTARAPEDAEEIGTTACAYCHPDEAASHAATGHGGAAAFYSAAADEAFEGGWSVDLGEGAVARLLLDGGVREVVVADASGAESTYAVQGWIGDPRRSSVPWTGIGADVFPLPIAWIAADPDRAALSEGQAHLAPYEPSRWLDGGLARVPAPSESAGAQCLGCHVTGFRATLRADGGVDLASSWPYSPDPRFADPSVGCERCHGPGSTHSEASIADKPWTIVRPDRLDPDAQDDLCASCHSAVRSVDGDLPWAYVAGAQLRPGDHLGAVAIRTPATWPSGTASAPHEQADELAASPHGEGYVVGCLDCHEPHGAAGHARMLRAPADDPATCLGCHLESTFDGDPSAVEAHSGHTLYDPTGLGSGSCVGCHLARTSTDTELGRDGGGGRVASHSLVAQLPQTSVDAFGGADALPLAEIPPDPCLDCHAEALAEAPDSGAPAGDPTRRATHERLQRYADRMFP